MSRRKISGTPRERLLQAASELFYDEGVHSVGIDRILSRADVAKASLYSSFGSKEELVAAYLEQRAERRQKRIVERLETLVGPRTRVLGVFDLLGEIVSEPGFRGCAFVNASAEGVNKSKIGEASARQRKWVRDLFTDLVAEHGIADPRALGDQLALLYDGVMVGASMDRDPTAAHRARTIAETLLNAHTAKH